MARQRGFTLIELMVVVAIVAILAAIALPAFTEQMRKSRRSEAMNTLSDLQLRQERWRANNATYGTLAQLGATSTIPSGYYTIELTTPATPANCPSGAPIGTANSYSFTATKAGIQASDNRCATMVLTNTCGTITKTSTPTGSTCWQ